MSIIHFRILYKISRGDKFVVSLQCLLGGADSTVQTSTKSSEAFEIQRQFNSWSTCRFFLALCCTNQLGRVHLACVILRHLQTAGIYIIPVPITALEAVGRTSGVVLVTVPAFTPFFTIPTFTPFFRTAAADVRDTASSIIASGFCWCPGCWCLGCWCWCRARCSWWTNFMRNCRLHKADSCTSCQTSFLVPHVSAHETSVQCSRPKSALRIALTVWLLLLVLDTLLFVNFIGWFGDG